MKRIFVGIRTTPDKNFMKLYSSLKKELESESVKWSVPENIHLTLVFLGQTDESKISSIEDVLQAVCDGKKAFEISLNGIGVFKNMHDPKVLWTGVTQSDLLSTLQGEIAAGLREKGFDLEEKPFSPHITIGRIKTIKDKDALKVLLLKHHATDIQSVKVNEVILYESVLKQEGPVYKPISIFSLL